MRQLPPIPTLFPYTTLFRSTLIDAVSLFRPARRSRAGWLLRCGNRLHAARGDLVADRARAARDRSEEHTSELQSRRELVCRLLLEKKKIYYYTVVWALSPKL